jgi:hypothetical protein
MRTVFDRTLKLNRLPEGFFCKPHTTHHKR